LLDRRSFLLSSWGAAAVPAGLGQGGSARTLTPLGIDTWSLEGFRWNVFQLLDYAADLELDLIQAGQPDFESYDEPYLKKVKEHADRVGVRLQPAFECGSPASKGWNPAKQGDPTTHLLKGIRTARTFGSPVFRVSMGTGADRGAGTPMPALMEGAIKVLRTVRSQAVDAGVTIGVENHGDFQARELKTVIEQAGKEFVGVCLDNGNPVMVLEDPMFTLETLAPYVVSSHIRDSVVYEVPQGAAWQWVALGDGSTGLQQFVARLRELCPRAPFLLEIITGGRARVMPYLEPGFWKAYPDMPAADFARFIALAKKGRPFMGSMMIAPPGKTPPEYQAAMKQQQRVDLERSLEYAKKTLDVGVRWRA